jgi:hypothetical protein
LLQDPTVNLRICVEGIEKRFPYVPACPSNTYSSSQAPASRYSVEGIEKWLTHLAACPLKASLFFAAFDPLTLLEGPNVLIFSRRH